MQYLNYFLLTIFLLGSFQLDAQTQKRFSFESFLTTGLTGLEQDEDRSTGKTLRIFKFHPGLDASLGAKARFRLDRNDHFALNLGLAYSYLNFEREEFIRFFSDVQNRYLFELVYTNNYHFHNLIVPLTTEFRLGKISFELGVAALVHLGGRLAEQGKSRDYPDISPWQENTIHYTLNKTKFFGSEPFVDTTKFSFERNQNWQFLCSIDYAITSQIQLGIQYRNYFGNHKIIERVTNYDAGGAFLSEHDYQSGTLSLQLSYTFKVSKP